MQDRALLKFGLTGTIVTAICCFTPTLAWLLALSGLASWLAWLDYVLLPLKRRPANPATRGTCRGRRRRGRG
jgi:mercuric ion transport protein